MCNERRSPWKARPAHHLDSAAVYIGEIGVLLIEDAKEDAALPFDASGSCRVIVGLHDYHAIAKLRNTREWRTTNLRSH